MPQNKRIVFPIQQQEIAAHALALSHPARLSILKFLQQYSFSVCDEIAVHLPLARPTVSHHLRFLLKAGLIRRRVLAGMVGYELHQSGWELARRQLREFLN